RETQHPDGRAGGGECGDHAAESEGGVVGMGAHDQQTAHRRNVGGGRAHGTHCPWGGDRSLGALGPTTRAQRRPRRAPRSGVIGWGFATSRYEDDLVERPWSSPDEVLNVSDV